MVWSRLELNLASHRLPLVAHELGVPLKNHHDAAEDAEACARIFLALAEKRGSRTVEEFATEVRSGLKTLGPNGW